MNTHELKQALRNGPYAWPGGYPVYFIAGDGEALSFGAVRANLRLCLGAMRRPGTGEDWRIVAVDVNYEDPDLYCAHTGQPIEAAYPSS